VERGSVRASEVCRFIQHAADVRSLVHVVADENDEVVRGKRNHLEERFKRFQVTVDVADHEDFHEGFGGNLSATRRIATGSATA
jgi:hypothetical protein